MDGASQVERDRVMAKGNKRRRHGCKTSAVGRK